MTTIYWLVICSQCKVWWDWIISAPCDVGWGQSRVWKTQCGFTFMFDASAGWLAELCLIGPLSLYNFSFSRASLHMASLSRWVTILFYTTSFQGGQHKNCKVHEVLCCGTGRMSLPAHFLFSQDKSQGQPKAHMREDVETTPW